MTITETNRLTGEIFQYPAETPDEVITSLAEVMAAIDMFKKIKGRLNARSTELWQQKMEQSSER